MRLFIMLSCLCLSISSFAQRSPIPNLPAVDYQDAGFNTDSIDALIPIMDNFQQKDFRGMVVIKNNNIIMEWYYNHFWRKSIIKAVLIGAIIEETSGMSLKDFAKEKVFDPLGITEYYWYTNAANQTGAAGNLYLTTLDFAKLGVLVANEGKWVDKQIVQADYIEKLLARKVFDITDWFFLADTYGMLWYKTQRTFNGKKIEYLFASGNGGNHLVVVPEENMVIALTSTAYGTRYGQARTYNILAKLLNALE